jgi:CheY-like chemotaxis protein
MTQRAPSTSFPDPAARSGMSSVGQADTRPHILVVEDEPDIVDSLRDALEDDGYEVRAAVDVPQAFASLRRSTPHLILLDLMLPGMSGEEFLNIYRELPGPHVPVIVLTAAGHGAQQRAETLGADVVLAKPYGVQALLDVIAQHVSPAFRTEVHPDNRTEVRPG